MYVLEQKTIMKIACICLVYVIESITETLDWNKLGNYIQN